MTEITQKWTESCYIQGTVLMVVKASNNLKLNDF